MKRIIVSLVLMCVFSQLANAQCDKKILWTSGKQDFTNSKGEVQRAMQDKVTVEVSSKGIIFNHNDDPNDKMEGTIKAASCNWTEAFKNGKTVIKTELSEGHGDIHDGTVTIEGKDGIVTITLELEDKPDMIIKVYVDKFEEQS